MSIDLSMPSSLRARRRKIGYAGITAVGLHVEPGVYRLGAAENVEGLLSQLQPATWHTLQLERVVWTPGLAAARTVTMNVERRLADEGQSLGFRWYRTPIDRVDALIEAEVGKLRTRTWTHPELVEKLRREEMAEADRFVAGIF